MKHLGEVVLGPSGIWRTSGGKPATIKRWECTCGASGGEHSKLLHDDAVMRGHAIHVAAAKRRSKR